MADAANNKSLKFFSESGVEITTRFIKNVPTTENLQTAQNILSQVPLRHFTVNN
jgi:hypothetical protein